MYINVYIGKTKGCINIKLKEHISKTKYTEMKPVLGLSKHMVFTNQQITRIERKLLVVPEMGNNNVWEAYYKDKTELILIMKIYHRKR